MDYTKAMKWYELAAKNGYAPAQYALAIMYGDGKGVKNNEREAMKWLEKAAAQGHSDAAELLNEYRSLKG